MDIFEKASKLKLRFDTSKGQMSTEDLWDLSLQSLDTIAKATNRKLKDESEESFISIKTKSNTTAELQLDILKRVIEVKLEEKEAAKLRVEKAQKLSQLRDLVATKQNEQLAGKSLDEIQQMIKELEG